MIRRRSRPILPALSLLLPLAACHEAEKPDVVTAAQAESARQACTFKAGTLPVETLASDAPTGDKIPLDHIVLMMQENRSFDAYFSHLSVPGQTIEAASDDVTNPDPKGKPVKRFHWSPATASAGNPDGKDYYCFRDTEHGWDGTHEEFDDGALDGFVRANDEADHADGSGGRAMGYYDETDIPYYYALARSFAISDHHFCSTLGPTWPNRMFFLAATSFGLTSNVLVPEQPDGTPYPDIFQRLNDGGVSWKVYFVDLPTPAIFPDTYSANQDHFAPLEQYFVDAKNGTLPAVSLVEGSDSGKGQVMLPDGSTVDAIDEHPPQNPQQGQAFVAKVVGALMHSPNWPRSAFILTYDEHGGEYDHVVPPKACPPDDLTPQLRGDTTMAGFDRYGFRTPLFVVSPYAKRGYVSHVNVDHTSIPRFIETRFNLPAMTARDANAWPLLDMFDFEHPDTSIPALPDAVIDQAQAAQCLTDYPPSKSGF